MLIKQYNLYENFTRVYPQFIDTRLIDRWINPKTDKHNIANTITHLLIYKDALFSAENIEQIQIIDTLIPISIETKIVYCFNDINFSYGITISDIKKVVNQQPISAPIQHILVDLLGYKIQTMGRFTIKTDVWAEVFMK